MAKRCSYCLEHIDTQTRRLHLATHEVRYYTYIRDGSGYTVSAYRLQPYGIASFDFEHVAGCMAYLHEASYEDPLS